MAKNTKKEKRRLLFISVAILLLLAFLVGSVYNDVITIYNNRKAVSQLKVEYEELLDKQKKLSSEALKMQDPEYVVRYAKEKYLYSSDDEIIIRVD